MKRLQTIYTVTAMMAIVLAVHTNLHAELRDWGAEGEYFYDTDTGLYWCDPAEFVDWSYSDIDAFVTASPIWKWASSDEIDALVGKSSEGGVPLTEVMGPHQFQTEYFVDGIWYHGSRWIGYFEESPAQPDGWVVQTFFDDEPPVVNDLSTLGDSGWQYDVDNWTHGAWINSTASPCPPGFPAAGTDSFESVGVFEVEVLGGPTIQTPLLLDLNTEIRRSDPDGGGGRREVETEILSLDLVGGEFGEFSVKAGQDALNILTAMGRPDLFTPSLGEVESLDPTGNECTDFPADSFFDVFAVIETPMGYLFNKEPLLVVSQGIECFPPITFFLHESTTGFAIPLFSLSDPDGPPMAFLTTAVNKTEAEELIGVPVDDPEFGEKALGDLVQLLPEPLPRAPIIPVAVDIKPGSYPNSINPNAGGVIPVAILGTADFDASTVNPKTVALAGAGARGKGKSGKYGSIEDVDGDGDLDLVVQIVNEINWAENATEATLTGFTLDGIQIEGTDSVNIVPPEQ